jgi:hypothetical protein
LAPRSQWGEETGESLADILSIDGASTDELLDERAWQLAIALGAREITLGGYPALDFSPIRIKSLKTLRDFISALAELPGRSGTLHRHVDSTGAPVFIVHVVV